ncbi:MAG: DUF86 domain-containing protein [Candidatus Kerfeldbacteria bacterium]|nr:DUF86 domain-containing protein [Candidatus Kerfeldbacteria bacterium]
MLDHEFLQRKVKLIQEDLNTLEQFKDFTFDELAKDSIMFSATERYLERIVTRAIDINRHVLAELGTGAESARTYEDTFLELAKLKVYPENFAKEIAPSAGLRNVLVHEYDEVDKRLVYESVGKALAQYARYCEYVLKLVA